MSPHQQADGDRIRFDGPTVVIGPSAATSLALVLHELATNATKYGALSLPEGRLDIGWIAEDGLLVLTWSERGGPPLEAAPEHRGFGSKLARSSVEIQLGGTIAYD